MTNRVAVDAASPVSPRFDMIDLALFSMTMIWGLNAVIVKATYAQIPPMAFMVLRFIIAGALLLAMLWRAERSLRLPRRKWMAFIAAGMVGTGFYQPDPGDWRNRGSDLSGRGAGAAQDRRGDGDLCGAASGANSADEIRMRVLTSSPPSQAALCNPSNLRLRQDLRLDLE